MLSVMHPSAAGRVSQYRIEMTAMRPLRYDDVVVLSVLSAVVLLDEREKRAVIFLRNHK